MSKISEKTTIIQKFLKKTERRIIKKKKIQD